MERSVVVTGCGTGIGRAIFDRLLDDGWAVVGLEMQEGLADTARVRAGAQGDVLLGDVAQTANLEAAADRAQQLAPLRGWVNNAALALSSNLHEPDVARIERVISVNLMGYFWGSSVAIRRFLAHRLGGAIVNISSIHGTPFVRRVGGIRHGEGRRGCPDPLHLRGVRTGGHSRERDRPGRHPYAPV